MKKTYDKMTKPYRALTGMEIEGLINNNCRCTDWNKIFVDEDFSYTYIRNVNFSGDIRIGTFNKEHTVIGNIQRHSGLYNATIHNCVIGNDVYINQVRSYMANYIVEENVVIDDVDLLYVDGESSFGNGTEVIVLCETGGREVKICDQLSAQLAYIYAMYRDRYQTITILNDMVDKYTSSVKSDRGLIGHDSKILSSRIVKDTKIGAFSHISGVLRLDNVTINSCQEAPTFIGMGVIIDNSIVSTNCNIFDCALIYSCFIGQGCEIGEQFSAEQSLFFANCIGLHGEACSIFAGPFTVTHHKNTLLIAGMYSFMNAGSGTNQSNHMYKLGPMHQGVIERGSKTASDSYIKWPSKVGPFTVVMGRHYHNSDTSNFPFSYLIEKNDDSVLVPGVNLRSVGTIRDVQKWPKRDKRTGNSKLDCINYNLLSPFTIHRVFAGIKILSNLQDICGETSNNYAYSSTIIKSSSLTKGIQLYNCAIYKFLGNSIISRIENSDCSTDEKLVQILKPDTEIGLGDWLDISGLIAPKSEILKVLVGIDEHKLNCPEDINKAFSAIHDNYYTYEWTWALQKIEELLGKPYTEFTRSDVAEFVKTWLKAVVDIDDRLLDDAKKEFAESVKIGFGADGNKEDKEKDFNGVRGNYDNNTFVNTVRQHIVKKSSLGEKILAKLID